MVGPLEMETDSLVSTGETRHDQEKLKGHGNERRFEDARNLKKPPDFSLLFCSISLISHVYAHSEAQKN